MPPDQCRPLAADEIPILRQGEVANKCDRIQAKDVPPEINSDLDPIALWKSARPSIVKIELETRRTIFETLTTGQLYQPSGSGSGFAVAAKGDSCLIVTNNHVAKAGSKIIVKDSNGGEHEATVKAKLEDVDLALIGTKSTGKNKMACLPLTLASEVSSGGRLILGHPQGFEPVFASYAVSTSTTTPNDLQHFFPDSKLLQPGENPNRKVTNYFGHTEPGSSGSPALTRSGTVSDIVHAGLEDTFTFATPASEAIRLLQQYRTTTP